MEQPSNSVFTDDRVASAILDVIRSANEKVVLVSPYNKFWDHLRNAITLAIGRGVKITVVYRIGEDESDIQWLVNQGAAAVGVDKLHAKLFLNESSLLMTSMNLLEVSSKNSHEVAVLIGDGTTQSELRDYVQNGLVSLGRPLKPSRPQSVWDSPITKSTTVAPRRTVRRDDRLPRTDSTPPTAARKLLNTMKVALTGGRCIRCQEVISYKLTKPLCDTHFKSWNRYKDRDYPENYCHRCGKEADTSVAKPLCYQCYKEVGAR